ncbi:branched-chain amino acid ABC transporter permease [Aurantimonas sp. VKM B-3413]|uniref:branched-chain amino acid ABC transporter permease n=1 Tax=Aurantimonas sp. VKM B-3413 TaxID=2779401 RepID=UPI001E60A66B|nr:branched-chain amino acid ABC transporter permease [Aurantimonas sp. VKM B-3413]MCB8839777.1 branched-chain amino acid ABC transporter permease [Aurantimonas sp. VKM B-3413]
MNFWVMQGLNGLAFGSLLFILAAGFSLIFGLMRIANLAHGAFFMLGAYVGLSAIDNGVNFWIAILAGGLTVCILGGLMERLILRRLAGKPLAQVLVTLGIAFIIADGCLWLWSGDPRPLPMPSDLQGVFRFAGLVFPKYRLFVVVVAFCLAGALWLLLEKSRIGAMIRAGVDDMEMARVMGIRTSLLFPLVFCLGSALAGAGGVLAGPILSVYPSMDTDMLPMALVVVILGGVGSLGGAFVGALLIGFIYSYGQALVPDLAYVILFLPMVLVLTIRPTGLFGRRLV